MSADVYIYTVMPEAAKVDEADIRDAASTALLAAVES